MGILTVSEEGFGKRTSSLSYRVTKRGGKGITTMFVDNKTGPVAASFPVEQDDEIMVMTNGGQVVRTPVNCIRVASRKTRGVKIISTRNNEHVVSVEHVPSEKAASRDAVNRTIQSDNEDNEIDKALDGAKENAAAAQLESRG